MFILNKEKIFKYFLRIDIFFVPFNDFLSCIVKAFIGIT